MNEGISPKQVIKKLIESGHITCPNADLGGRSTQLQPASLDLSLGYKAYRIRASFLPGKNRTVKQCLSDVKMPEIDLSSGAVLETGCVYLVPLQEALNLPDYLSARANPKSSTGRLDVFTRVICDGANSLDVIPNGYQGPLYVEIAPRTFSILVKPGDRLVQMRFRKGIAKTIRTQTVSIDLQGFDSNIVGWRARRHAGLVDISAVDGHIARDYWEPLFAETSQLVLDPDEFYILASKESVSIPRNEAAEMAPIATEIGEFRAHYAGFFDPGFGNKDSGGIGSRGVLEVRCHEAPFVLEHGQNVGRLIYEKMTETPNILYGQDLKSNYQGQGLKLSKHFKSD